MSLKLGTTNISGLPTNLISTVNTKLDASTYTNNPRTNAVYLKTTYVNGTNGYRIWSDGYCEQWGTLSITDTAVTITVDRKFKDTTYIIFAEHIAGGDGANVPGIVKVSENEFTLNASSTKNGNWLAKGYLAAGQY